MDATAIPDISVETPAVVVFASVDDWGTGSDCESQLPRRAVDLLANSGVRLVLVSASAATDVRRVQRHLHITEPFVCDGGAAVHVPCTCFWNLEAHDAGNDGCEIFRFNPPDRAAAVNLVRDLFLSSGHDVVTIGIGCDLEDYGVLSAVDVPVVVRDPVKDQRELLRHVPGAYLTNATGIDGWSEALIGP
jgi:predicted mannosyl-3-phosphoglycerate phosphatase (HAD superfamily)